MDFLFLKVRYVVNIFSLHSRVENVHTSKKGEKMFSTLDNKLHIDIPIPHAAFKGRKWCKVALLECTYVNENI